MAATLKNFNSLSPSTQCEWVLDIIEGNTTNVELGRIVDEGVSQGENKENLVSLLLLLKSINKGQKTLLSEIKPLWVQQVRNKKIESLFI